MGFPSVRYTWSCLEFLGGVLFGLSLLGLIGAFLLGSWAALLKTYLGDYADLATPGEGYLWPITLCLTIVFVAPVHILGLALRSGLAKNFSSRRALRKSACSGSSLDRRIFLHVVLSCLSSFLVLGTCAGGAFFWSYSRRRIRQGLQKVVRNYSDNESAKLQMDRLQMELRCCGIDSYADWFFVPWTELYDEGFTESDKNYPDRVKSVERRGSDVSARGMRLITADVPFSCCATKNLRECIHRGIGIPGTGPSPTIATVGCQTKLLARANDAGRDIVACLLFVSAYQLTLSILSRLLQTARLNAIQTNVKGKHFVGWIFGHGPPNPPNAPNVLNVQPRETQRLRESSDETSDSPCKRTNRATCTSPKVKIMEPCENTRTKGHANQSRHKKTTLKYVDIDTRTRVPDCCKTQKSKRGTRGNSCKEQFRTGIREHCNEKKFNKDALEKRQYRMCPKASKILLPTRDVNECQFVNKRKHSCAEKEMPSSSSSTSLPPLPSTPRMAAQRPKKSATQYTTSRGNIMETKVFCQLHNRYPIHPFDNGRDFPQTEIGCPLHGDVHDSDVG